MACFSIVVWYFHWIFFFFFWFVDYFQCVALLSRTFTVLSWDINLWYFIILHRHNILVLLSCFSFVCELYRKRKNQTRFCHCCCYYYCIIVDSPKKKKISVLNCFVRLVFFFFLLVFVFFVKFTQQNPFFSNRMVTLLVVIR